MLAVKPEPPELISINGAWHFRGLPLETRKVELAGAVYRLAALKDAADLLDEPDFAKRFIEQDLAPYGMELWPAAIMLARYILTHDLGENREALELGAGLGLVGLAATRAGWRVRVSDHEPVSLQFAAYNAQLNDVAIHDYAVLDWHAPPPTPKYARIFAADVLYQLVDHEPILTCLRTILACGGTALIADPRRGVADHFDTLARSHGFTVDTMETGARNQQGDAVRGRIFKLEKP